MTGLQTTWPWLPFSCKILFSPLKHEHVPYLKCSFQKVL